MAAAIEDRPVTATSTTGRRTSPLLLHFIAEARRQLGPDGNPVDVAALARALLTAHLHRAARQPRSSRRAALQRAAARRANGNGHHQIHKTDVDQNDEAVATRPTASKEQPNGNGIRRST